MKKSFTIAILLALQSAMLIAGQPVEFLFQDPAKGVISMANKLPDRDLSSCGIYWLLLENGHKLEIAELANMRAEPNAIAYVEFPYATKPFKYGGERWVRMEVRDKKGNIDQPDNKVLAWAQFPLPETTSPPPREFGAESMPPISVTDNKDTLRASNKPFSIVFNKQTGKIDDLRYKDKPRIRKGPSLALRGRRWKSKLLQIKHSSPSENILRVETKIQYQLRKEPPIVHHMTYLVYGDGTIRIDSSVSSAKSEKPLPSPALKMNLYELKKFDWYGGLPQEDYCEGKEGSPIECYKRTDETLTPSGGKSVTITDGRWVGLTDKYCRGILLGHINKYIKSEIKIADDKTVNLTVTPNPSEGKTDSGPFSIRIRAYDSLLSFADKLWYVKSPPIANPPSNP